MQQLPWKHVSCKVTLKILLFPGTLIVKFPSGGLVFLGVQQNYSYMSTLLEVVTTNKLNPSDF